MVHHMISAAQIKAARALLSIDQRELSNSAEVAVSTVKRIELADELTGSVRTLWKIQSGAVRCWGLVHLAVSELRTRRSASENTRCNVK